MSGPMFLYKDFPSVADFGVTPYLIEYYSSSELDDLIRAGLSEDDLNVKVLNQIRDTGRSYPTSILYFIEDPDWPDVTYVYVGCVVCVAGVKFDGYVFFTCRKVTCVCIFDGDGELCFNNAIDNLEVLKAMKARGLINALVDVVSYEFDFICDELEHCGEFQLF